MGVRAWLWRVGSRESRVRKWGLVVKPYATSMGRCPVWCMVPCRASVSVGNEKVPSR